MFLFIILNSLIFQCNNKSQNKTKKLRYVVPPHSHTLKRAKSKAITGQLWSAVPGLNISAVEAVVVLMLAMSDYLCGEKSQAAHGHVSVVSPTWKMNWVDLLSKVSFPLGGGEEQAAAATVGALLCGQLGGGVEGEEGFKMLRPILSSILIDSCASLSARQSVSDASKYVHKLLLDLLH